MAILWERSAIPWVDGDQAFSGAKAYFFDAGTTTPMITYTDAAESIPHDHPVVANSRGIFPPIFLADAAIYKFRVLDADDATIVEADNVAAPTTEPPEFPTSETLPEFLFQTGDMKEAWRADAPTGWVRCNGRTIGAAASGASERANADCEALFLFLWTKDANLSVSGGRGGSAAGDWAAAKTIVLPDVRGRGGVGPDSFGNSASGRITDAELGADSDLLGASGGDATQALTMANLPASPPTGTVGITDPGHKHLLVAEANSNDGSLTATRQLAQSGFSGGDGATNLSETDTAATVILSASNTTGISAAFTGANLGSGTAHNNLQPSVVIPRFIKL